MLPRVASIQLRRRETDDATEWPAARPRERIWGLQRKTARGLRAKSGDRYRDWQARGLDCGVRRDLWCASQTSPRGTPWLRESWSARRERSDARKFAARSAEE